MKKIKFNYILLIFVAAILLPVSCNKCDMKKNIGLQLYSLRDSMRTDPVKTVQEVGKMGYYIR